MEDTLFAVRDQVIVVTGGGGGLGEVYVRGLAERGARVLVADINGAAAEGLATQLRELDHDVVSCEVDVSDERSVDSMVQTCLESFGRIDGLVNNAGINLPRGSLLNVSLEDWNRINQVNVTGVFLCTRAVAKVMAERGSGAIINIASTVAVIAIPNIAAYTATKGAVAAFTRASAAELAPLGIRVNAIAPGFVTTPMSAGWATQPERLKQYNAMIASVPMQRPAEPAELVGSVVFLCSRASSYLTGATLVVDGGFTIV